MIKNMAFRAYQRALAGAALGGVVVVMTTFAGSGSGVAATQSRNDSTQDLLIKVVDSNSAHRLVSSAQRNGAFGETLTESPSGGHWVHVKNRGAAIGFLNQAALAKDPAVLAVQPNYKIHLLENYRTGDPGVRAQVLELLKTTSGADLLARHLIEPLETKGATKPALVLATATSGVDATKTPFSSGDSLGDSNDNPEIPSTPSAGIGPDPLYKNQWGMIDMGVAEAWKSATGKGVVVAVLDTGVDYTHEDLVDNLWHNPGEMGVDASGKDKSNNGIDDDGNGLVDDVIGWDFVSNDNKPYDLSAGTIQVLLSGGNPGHGTHCAGNVAARANNGKGIGGVAPEAQIMAMRFLDQKGEGDTAGAIKAIDYAVRMGAKVLSNSWGSEGEDSSESAKNQALRDSITNAQKAGVLFIAAAGNGHEGAGYDNDTDSKPGYPASYSNENILSVAAIDKDDQLAAFSNWGAKTVHIAAPGVAIFSTTVHGNYSDTIVDILGLKATWDGTSMATPHVAGAAALYWSKHPQAKWQEVRAALLTSAKKLDSLNGKVSSGGKLSVTSLMK